MEHNLLLAVVLPAALFVIMLGMGLTLTPADFRRVLAYPRAVMVGLAGQWLLLPLIGWGVTLAFGLPPELAAGLMILAFAPGGATSNMISYLSRGDVALSITLTAVVSLLTPFTLPLFSQWVLDHWLGSSQPISLPLGKTVLQLLLITVLPVAAGMGLQRRWPLLGQRLARIVKPLSIAFLLLVIGAIVAGHWTRMPVLLVQVGLPCLALNVLTLLAGWQLGRWARLQPRQTITVAIEVGVQNGGTALLITGTILGNATLSIPPVMYGILMLGPSLLLGAWLGRRLTATAAAPCTS